MLQGCAGRGPPRGDGSLDGRYYDYQTVSPEYFEALGVSLVQGRGFAESDSSGAVIVNEAFAREFFGNGSALGKSVTVLGWRPGLRDVAAIVGVVADSLVSPWQIDGARPQFDLPYFGQPEETPGNMRDQRLTLSYLIRTQAAPSTVFPAAKRAVSAELPDLPVERLLTLESEFESVLGPGRTMAGLLGGLSLLAVLLTALGTYGVVAHSVSRRRQEFGIRLALGEDRRRLLAAVLGSVWRLAIIGIVCGTAGALVLLRVMQNRIFLVEEDRLAVFAAMVLALLAVASLAGYLPSRRASRLDPISVLRDE